MKRIKNIYNKYSEIINYIIVGGFTTLVSLATYYICIEFLNPNNPILLQISNIVSWICSVTFAYFSNRKFVFKSKEKNVLKEASKFYTSRITTLLLDALFMFILVTVLKGNAKIAKLLVQIIILIINYIFSKLIVFNKKTHP